MRGQDDTIELSDHQFHDFQEIFEQAFAKINATPQLKDVLHRQESSLAHDPVGCVLNFIDHYQTPLSSPASLPATSAEKLALDFFFLYQPGHYFRRHFLFGTPSQKRPPSRGG